MRVEDALPLVDKFLDNAIVHNLPFVRIIHGHGSGRLMKEIHKFLKKYPHVKSFRLAQPHEGGPAATVVNL
jgi:DNA mismatch repair protein MutS2